MKSKTLERARTELRRRHDLLRGRLGDVGTRVRHEVAPPGEVTHVPTHDADQGSAGVDPILSLGEQQREELVEIDAALLRIERGEYGRCATCGGPVSEERLEALPQARDCETCAHVRS